MRKLLILPVLFVAAAILGCDSEVEVEPGGPPIVVEPGAEVEVND